jgi:GNAT superfamily N-acetyltransferase
MNGYHFYVAESTLRVDSVMVRQAQPNDAVALAALNWEMNDEAIPPDRITARLRSESHSELVVVAEVGGHVVGFACVQLLWSICYAEPWAELTELYVRATHRRQGIGRTLVYDAERLAQEQGAKDILVRTGTKNAEGQALYEAMGYTTRPHLTLQKQLQKPADTVA